MVFQAICLSHLAHSFVWVCVLQCFKALAKAFCKIFACFPFGICSFKRLTRCSFIGVICPCVLSCQERDAGENAADAFDEASLFQRFFWFLRIMVFQAILKVTW